MAKKPRPEHGELLPPTGEQIAESFKQTIARIVEERVTEALAEASGGLLQPFFAPRDVTYAIRAKQTVTEQNKWKYYFEEHGCLCCSQTAVDVSYRACGMCDGCYSRTQARLERILKNHKPPDEPNIGLKDGVRIAQEALLPSLQALAMKKGKQIKF